MLCAKKRKRRAKASAQETAIQNNVDKSKELLQEAKEQMLKVEYILRAYSRSEL